MSAPRRRIIRLAPAALAALLLGGCASTHYRPISDSPVRIGPAYRAHGETYRPAADPHFDELGYASWYGAESGHQTANGERYRPGWITAANRTLPLPSYVEVTDLDSGKVILVRVNDRGPFGNDWRILDLSEGAAELLGMKRQGVAPVRVRVVEPSRRDRKRLMKGKAAKKRPHVKGRALADLRRQLAAGCARKGGC